MVWKAIVAGLLVLMLAGAGRAAGVDYQFDDEFTSPALNPAWTLRPGDGSISLTDNPGSLRYQLPNSPTMGGDASSLWITRPFAGDDWILDTRISYSLPIGGSRQLNLRILFGDLTARGQNEVDWVRDRDDAGMRNRVIGAFVDGGTAFTLATSGSGGDPTTAAAMLATPQDSYYLRLIRLGQTVTVQTSLDGASYTTLTMRTFTTPLPPSQTLLLNGAAADSSGGFADYDYVKLHLPANVWLLFVQSVEPTTGVPIGIGPDDRASQGAGTTAFVRTYNNGDTVTLSAPASMDGNPFQEWRVDNTPVRFYDPNTGLGAQGTVITQLMDFNHTITAVYGVPTVTLTVQSADPAMGVPIQVGPPDTAGLGDGATPLKRTYLLNTSVTLHAPPLAGTNTFLQWQQDGQFLSSAATIDLTLDGYHTLTAIYGVAPPPVHTGFINTIAGGGLTSNGPGDQAPPSEVPLTFPEELALDANGNLFIADRDDHRVRELGVNGTMRTVAGSGPVSPSQGSFAGDGGRAPQARLNHPHGVLIDPSGNLLIGDSDNQRVRKVDAHGVITTLAGSGGTGVGQGGFFGDGATAPQALLNSPEGMTMDAAGNLYFADTLNNRVRRIDPGGIITTIAGNGQWGYSGDGGPATQASLRSPCCVAVDMAGNLYIADAGNNRVRKVDSGGTISTVAGSGADGPGQGGFAGDGATATQALLNEPQGLAVDSAGNLYLSDTNNHRVRRVAPNGLIATIAGSGPIGEDLGSFGGDGGPATGALLNNPHGLAIDGQGNLYISDWGNGLIREVFAVAAPGLLDGKLFPGSQPLTVPGDVNGDGKITVADATLALRIAIGLLNPTDAQLAAGDLHGDGRVTIADATLILRKALGL